MFTSTHDDAVARWEEPEGEYAVAVDQDPPCPAANFYSCHNAARRRGDDWQGVAAVAESGIIASIEYNGFTFEGAAATEQEARDIATVYAHWAEGDVYVLGFSPADGSADRIVGDYYTSDGSSPELAQVKAAFQ